MMKRNQKGFTLIELMIVVAIIAIIAAVGVPIFLRAKITANEGAAIANLKNLSSGQTLFVESRVALVGVSPRYGALAELTGAHINGVVPGQNPSSLSAGLRPNVTVAGGVAGGAVNKSGYIIQVLLPAGAGVATDTDSLGLTLVGVPSATAGSRFRAYAWPTAFNTTGVRVFAVNETNDVISSPNATVAAPGVALHNGIADSPAKDSACNAASAANDDEFGQLFLVGVAALDGAIWTSSSN